MSGDGIPGPGLAPPALQLEHVACNLCGSPDYRVRYRMPDTWTRLVAFEFPVVECRACGLVYVNPRPTPEGMRPFYPAGYHARDRPEHERRYARQAALLPDLNGLRLLDLGCAEGDFLRHLRRRYPGAALAGTDYYAPSADRAPAGVDIFRGDLDAAPFPPASFDLATAWGVIEHLHDPLRQFRSLHRLLKPGGRLIFLVTNAESWYGRRAYREDVPRHLHHFSPRTLREYAARTGFRLSSCRCDDGVFDGRGTGTFWHGLTRLAGARWEERLAGRFTLPQKAAARVGGILDRLVFSTHWEARFGRSGILVATFERERAPS